MKVAPLKEYSLWLMPKGKQAINLKKFTNKVAKQAKTIPLLPHITLIGGIYIKPAQTIKKINRLTQASKPFKISFVKLGISDEFYKSLFLKCRNSAKLLELNKKAQKIFSKKYEYFPHMSLIYGLPEKRMKDLILKEITLSKIKSFSFKVESIFLCKAFGISDKWKIIYKSDFNK